MSLKVTRCSDITCSAVSKSGAVAEDVDADVKVRRVNETIAALVLTRWNRSRMSESGIIRFFQQKRDLAREILCFQ